MNDYFELSQAMSNDIPNGDPAQQTRELLAENYALEKRVDLLADGPMKTMLKEVLAELRFRVGIERPRPDRGN